MGWRESLYISCVYDERIVLLKWNGEMLMKWAVLKMLFVCLCPHWDVVRACVCVSKMSDQSVDFYA